MPFFEPVTSLDGAGRWLYVAEGEEAEVSVFEAASDGMALAARVRWTPGDRSITAEDVAAAKANLEEFHPIPRLLSLLTSDDIPIADRLPTTQQIRANRDGGFWVQRYPRVEFQDTYQWLSFDADGRFVCELTVPALCVLDVGRDYFLAETVRDAETPLRQVLRYGVGRP
jgi:hypothetical protein